MFCFYYGTIGHNERTCSKKKKDVSTGSVLKDRYSHWLRARGRNNKEKGYRGSDSGIKNMDTEVTARRLMLGEDKGGDNVKEYMERDGDGKGTDGS